MADENQLPRYARKYPEVAPIGALKITEVRKRRDSDACDLIFDHPAIPQKTMDGDWCAHFNPEPGAYFVVDEGHEQCWPAENFERSWVVVLELDKPALLDPEAVRVDYAQQNMRMVLELQQKCVDLQSRLMAANDQLLFKNDRLFLARGLASTVRSLKLSNPDAHTDTCVCPICRAFVALAAWDGKP